MNAGARTHTSGADETKHKINKVIPHKNMSHYRRASLNSAVSSVRQANSILIMGIPTSGKNVVLQDVILSNGLYRK